MRWAGGLTALVAVVLAGPLTTDAEAAKRTNYSSSAAKVAKGLSKARSDSAAKKQMLALFRNANVTVLGNGRRPKRLVRGFARSPQDFFLVEPQVMGLGRLAREKTEAPVSQFAVALSELAGKPITGEQTAQALRLWITDARKTARRRPRDKRVFVPLVIDRLARARGVDLTKATAETRISGIEMYLAEMTLAPARPEGRRVALPDAAGGPFAAGGSLRAASICGEINAGTGLGSWAVRSLAWALVRVVDTALPWGLSVRSLSQVAVGLGTSIRLAPGSETFEGRPIHWQHFDDSSPDEARFKLLFTSDLPVPRTLSECLQTAGIEVPPRGGTRANVPVVWWLDDGTPTASEIDGQTLKMQGRWQKEGPDSSISQITEAISGPLPGGTLLGSSASDSGGVATMKYTPRREPGPYPGPSQHVRGDLRAFPLVFGTEGNLQRVASLFSAVIRNKTFKVDVEHHVKLGWRFADGVPVESDYTIPCDGEGCPTPVHIEFAPVRCAPADPAVGARTDPQLNRSEPIGVTGNWLTPPFPGGRKIVGGNQPQPWAPAFVVPDPGGSAGWGSTQGGTQSPADRSPNMFVRGPDSPNAANLTVEFWDDNGEGDWVKKNERAVNVVPMRDALELPPGFQCLPKELLEEQP